MRLGLVPESGRRDIRLLVVVASVMTPSQILYRDLQVLVEAYRVKDMPAVQPESGHRTVQPVGTDYLVHAGILPDCSTPRRCFLIIQNKYRKINTYLMGGGGFEPPKQVAADLQSVPFGHSGIRPYHSDKSK